MKELPTLKRDSLPADPIELVGVWVDDAMRLSGLANPDAAFLATVGADGAPDGRIVLVKELRADGFVFFTNRNSPKGRDLDERPEANLTFFWDGLGRQIRIAGSVAPVSDEESDAYFATRGRGSQIGAWASDQSRPLGGRAALEDRVREHEAEFAGRDVMRPPHWGGYRVAPRRIEFWQAAESRLHDRFEYQRAADGGWSITRLYP